MVHASYIVSYSIALWHPPWWYTYPNQYFNACDYPDCCPRIVGFPEHITSTLDEGFLSPHTTSWIIFPEWPSGWWNIIILIQCRFTQHTREASYRTPLNKDGTSDMQGDMFNMFGFQVSVRVWSVTSLGVSAMRDIPIYLLIRLIRCSEGGQTTLWPSKMFDRAVQKHQLYTSNKGSCFYPGHIMVKPSEWSASERVGYEGRKKPCWLPPAGHQLLIQLLKSLHWGGDLGSVGDFAAGSEMAFCTLLQRSYAVLGGRMYLGCWTGAAWEKYSAARGQRIEKSWMSFWVIKMWICASFFS